MEQKFCQCTYSVPLAVQPEATSDLYLPTTGLGLHELDVLFPQGTDPILLVFQLSKLVSALLVYKNTSHLAYHRRAE